MMLEPVSSLIELPYFVLFMKCKDIKFLPSHKHGSKHDHDHDHNHEYGHERKNTYTGIQSACDRHFSL